MKYLKSLIIIHIITISFCFSQKESPKEFLSKVDILFLEQMTQDVLEASRIYPDQFISKEFGANKTGETLIRPGGKDAYPAFWIRDYAMSLETGMVTKEEQLHMLMLTASTQCDQSRVTKGGGLIPFGSIPDHIRIDDSMPIYYPGTYNYDDQGTPEWGVLPPYCDQFYFVHMAYYYVKFTGDNKILWKEVNGTRLIDRLKTSFHVPPSTQENHIVYATEAFRGVDFGFRDAQTITGSLSFPSILKYRAANELAELLKLSNSDDWKKYEDIASKIKETLPALFMDERGMLLASTGRSKQADVWATALAIYYGILEGDHLKKASDMLTSAYNSGTLSYKGNIRHILTTDDFSKNTAWELSLSSKNKYQNGAYWGTPTGWVCYAINKVDPQSSKALATEFIEDLKLNDYRKGGAFGAPYECFNKSSYTQNSVYLTTVACPLVAFRKIAK